MDDSKLYTYEGLHNAFRDYLIGKFENNEVDVNAIQKMMEEEMPHLLKEYFGTTYHNIYELLDTGEIEDYRKKIKSHPVLKNMEMRMDLRYTEALKWYRLFVKNQHKEKLPLKVPGEGTSKSTSAKEVKVMSTIYLEGEAGESQSKEIRQRNKELRQACIDYFKAQHSGHLVCECCGFEFTAHYDIEDEYIEVHHRFPFSQTVGEHPVNAITDLVPLCANCHRMIHHGQGGNGNCMSLDDLKKKLK